MEFQTVIAKRCSNPEHIVWEVTYSDGTPGHFHQGNWPNHLGKPMQEQLRAARERFLRREERGTRPERERDGQAE